MPNIGNERKLDLYGSLYPKEELNWEEEEDLASGSSLLDFNHSWISQTLYFRSYCPRVLLAGNPGMGQSRYFGPAILEKLERWKYYTQCLDITYLMNDSTQVM